MEHHRSVSVTIQAVRIVEEVISQLTITAKLPGKWTSDKNLL